MSPERSTPVPPRRAAREVRRRLEQVVAGPEGDERDGSEWAELRGLLASVASSERGPAWREASVLTDLAFRQRPKQTHRQLRRMRQRRRAHGEVAGFDRFWTECRRVLAPYTLSPHGYHLALGGRDADRLWRTVAEVTSRFAELGHPVFVVSGTLLGLVRDGGFLEHDDDVDLAVVLGRDDTPDAAGAARAWRELRRRATEAGLLTTGFEKRRAGHCRAANADGLTIDLFPAWQAGDRLFVWPHTYGEVAATDVLPPEPRRIGADAAVVLVPRNPELLLQANYGPDWREPDPTFRFDWKRAHRRFADFIDNLGSRRPSLSGPRSRVSG